MCVTRIALSAVAAFLVLAQTAIATEIVVIRTQDSIFLGADSVQTEEQGTSLICKIGQNGHVFFAATGFAKWDDKTANLHFDALSLASQSCDAGGMLADTVKRFELLLRELYPEALQGLENRFPAKYEQLARDGKPLKVFFVGIEGGTAVLYQRAIRLFPPPSNHNDIAIEPVTDCPGKDCLDNRALFRLAGDPFDELTAYLEANRERLQQSFYSEPVEVIRATIQVAADAASRHATPRQPASVGPPIVILKIAKGKIAEWVTEKGKCPEIQPYAIELGPPASPPAPATSGHFIVYLVIILAVIATLIFICRKRQRERYR